MLSDMSNSTAELSVASHQVLEVKGVSSSQPNTLISKSVSVPGCSRGALCSQAFSGTLHFLLCFWVLSFPCPVSQTLEYLHVFSKLIPYLL